MASARARGDEGEQFLQSKLQTMFTGCSCTSTARVGMSGDLRLDIPVESGNDISIYIECKNHRDSVSKAQVNKFTEHLQSPAAAWADVALFVSCVSSVHGHPDFTVRTLLDGREYCVISCVMENPERLEAAVRLVLARGQSRRQHNEKVAAAVNMERQDKLNHCLSSQECVTSNMGTIISSLNVELSKVQRIIQQMQHVMQPRASGP